MERWWKDSDERKRENSETHLCQWYFAHTDLRSNPGLRGKYWGTGVNKLNKKLGTISKFRAPEGWHETEGPQILGANVPNVVAVAILCPGLVQFWVTKLGTFRIQYSDAFVYQLYLSPYLEILEFLNGRPTPLQSFCRLEGSCSSLLLCSNWQ
jgi:hypothetical protein